MIRCLLLGHSPEYENQFNSLGRHLGVEVCSRCGEELEIAYTGAIFPGEADDPEKAVKYIEQNTHRDPPKPGDDLWDWRGIEIDDGSDSNI